MAEKKEEPQEKPLEKMTAKELREVAKEIPEISGVHGMNKDELLSAVKAARGIVEEKQKSRRGDVRTIKKQIKELKLKRKAAIEGSDKRLATIYRRRISRLKKKSRRAA
jgi:hypothetical protein